MQIVYPVPSKSRNIKDCSLISLVSTVAHLSTSCTATGSTRSRRQIHIPRKICSLNIGSEIRNNGDAECGVGPLYYVKTRVVSGYATRPISKIIKPAPLKQTVWGHQFGCLSLFCHFSNRHEDRSLPCIPRMGIFPGKLHKGFGRKERRKSEETFIRWMASRCMTHSVRRKKVTTTTTAAAATTTQPS